MKTTSEMVDSISSSADELIEMAEEAMKLEALVADIKATAYSPFSNEEMKIKFIKKAIEKAGF
jgi:hypothetical protein